MNTVSSILNRTSYRGKFKETLIPREDLMKIVEAGVAAPSGCNKQTTSFIVVDDIKLLKKLKSVITPPICETAPAMICVLTQKIIAYRDKSFYVQDYSAAIENMLLAIVELGYQSCWVEGHITDEDNIGRQMADILGVPKDYDLVCFLPIGYADEPIKHIRKKTIEQRVWYNGYMNKQ